ncbi:MAG TPA: ParB/RepB/Spo0J family partition protein [Pirellulales bacterium]|jgi:ParB family chromosome partitioning protein|nr:ParB/RepB/Spo0J family partition protein [Pirellulales bacterium]
MSTTRRLGRGLEALLGHPFGSTGENNENAPAESSTPISVEALVAVQPEAIADTQLPSGMTQLSVYDIDGSPHQPRDDFNDADLESLTQSLRDHGLIQPIVVRRLGDRYQLIAGERRLRAAIKAGWSQVPAQIREADDRQVAELAIIENLQRKDLNAIEKAASFQQYLNNYGCTQEELAGRLAVDRSTVANLIRLLELPEVVQEAVCKGAISAGHARALLPLGDQQRQAEFCEKIKNEELSVRTTEQLVQETLDQAGEVQLTVVDENGESHPAAASRRRTRSRQTASLEQEFKGALGTKVQISQTAKGKGKIVIHFANHDEFERLRGQLTHGVQPQAQTG